MKGVPSSENLSANPDMSELDRVNSCLNLGVFKHDPSDALDLRTALWNELASCLPLWCSTFAPSIRTFPTGPSSDHDLTRALEPIHAYH